MNTTVYKEIFVIDHILFEIRQRENRMTTNICGFEHPCEYPLFQVLRQNYFNFRQVINSDLDLRPAKHPFLSNIVVIFHPSSDISQTEARKINGPSNIYPLQCWTSYNVAIKGEEMKLILQSA